MMKSFFFFAILSLAVAVLYRLFAPHYAIQELNKDDYPYFVLKNMFSEKDFNNLVDLARKQEFELTKDAENTLEHPYGSADFTESGDCPHMLLHANKNKTKCVILARNDVGAHYLKTGGYNAKKEYSKTLTNRGLFFQKFFFSKYGDTSIPELEAIFASDNYSTKAKQICEGRTLLDPIQVSILINLPGQEVAMHYDVPWFHGADKWNFPPWLLVVMEQSKLYKSRRIPQIQGVSYLHTWDDHENKKGGFYFFNKGNGAESTLAKAVSNQALILDGSLCAHATQTFSNRPVKELVQIDRNKRYYMDYQGNKNWNLYAEDKKTVIKSFKEEELRFSLVWRQKCYKNQEEKRKHEAMENPLDPNEVVEELLDNLISLGKITQKPSTEYEKVSVLVSNYIRYPYPPGAAFPYNYCLLFEKYFPSWFKNISDLLCE